MGKFGRDVWDCLVNTWEISKLKLLKLSVYRKQWNDAYKIFCHLLRSFSRNSQTKFRLGNLLRTNIESQIKIKSIKIIRLS